MAHITGDLTVTVANSQEYTAVLDAVANNPALTITDSNEAELWITMHFDQTV